MRFRLISVPLKEWRTFAPEVRVVFSFGGVFKKKTKVSMQNRQELMPTNLAKVNKLPTPKVWASGYGTGGQSTR